MQKANPSKRVGEFLLNYALYIMLGAILITVSIIRPNFIAIDNIMNILKQASTKGILALGCAGLIVLAGTDLSIGRVLGLSAAVTASLVQSVNYASRYFPNMTEDLWLIVPFLAAIAIAVIFSLINGFGVAHLKMHAFIITLGTQLIAYGANCLYIEAQPSGTAQALSTFNKTFLNTGAGNLLFGQFSGDIYIYTTSNSFLIKISGIVLALFLLAIVALILFNSVRALKDRLGGKIRFLNYALFALIFVLVVVAIVPSFAPRAIVSAESEEILAKAQSIDAPISEEMAGMEPQLAQMNEGITAQRAERNTLITQSTEAEAGIKASQSDIAILKGEKQPSPKQKSVMGAALTDETVRAEKLAEYEARVAEWNAIIETNAAGIADYDAKLEESTAPYNELNAQYRKLVAEHNTLANIINNLSQLHTDIESKDVADTAIIDNFTSSLSSMTNSAQFGVSILKIPLVVLYFLLLALIMWVVWNKTRLGKNMFAVGGNQEAAAVSGVNVAKTIMLVYLIAGVLYGIASFLEAARVQSVGANTGINYECDAISACVIGGVSFSGGVGTIQGVVIGAIILQAINFSLNFLGVNPYYQFIIRGLIIILAVAIDVRKYLVKK